MTMMVGDGRRWGRYFVFLTSPKSKEGPKTLAKKTGCVLVEMGCECVGVWLMEVEENDSSCVVVRRERKTESSAAPAASTPREGPDVRVFKSFIAVTNSSE